MKSVIILLLAFITLGLTAQNSVVPTNQVKTDKITKFKTNRVEHASITLFSDTTIYTRPIILWGDTATELTDFSLYDGVLGTYDAPMPMVYCDCRSNGHFNVCDISVALGAGQSYTLPATSGKTAMGTIFLTGTDDYTGFGIGPDASTSITGDHGSIGWANTLTTNKHCLIDQGNTATVTNNTSTTYSYHITIKYVR